MTPQEIQAAVQRLEVEIGPKAQIFARVNSSGPACSASVYPNGLVGHHSSISVDADDWEPLIEKLRAAWNKMASDHVREQVRNLALAIISVTNDAGVCADAGLRAEGFSQHDIDRYGSDACAEADSMAANGPFTIDTIANANAA